MQIFDKQTSMSRRHILSLLQNARYVCDPSYDLLSVTAVPWKEIQLYLIKLFIELGRRRQELLKALWAVDCSGIPASQIIIINHCILRPCQTWNFDMKDWHVFMLTVDKAVHKNDAVCSINADRKDHLVICTGCKYGKSIRGRTLRKWKDRGPAVLDFVRTDVCGLLAAKSANSLQYFILFINDRSGYCWVYEMEKKSTALATFSSQISMFDKQFRRSVIFLHSDNLTVEVITWELRWNLIYRAEALYNGCEFQKNLIRTGWIKDVIEH